MRRIYFALLVLSVVAAACGEIVAEEARTVSDTTAESTTPPGDDAEPFDTDSAPDIAGPATTPTSLDLPEPTVAPTTEPKPALTTSPPSVETGDTPPTTLAEPVAGQGMVDAAKADLASRLGMNTDDIGVVSIDEVTWRDGSLGCPQPDMSYIQVISNGTQIILLANGVQFHYHAGVGGVPFYCATPQEPLPPDAGGYGDV